MSYTLSADDFALLQRIAGGFNYARVGVSPADRFSASVKWANADALNDLVTRADPAAQPAPAVPDLGQLAMGQRVLFDGFGKWSLTVAVRSTVRVYEYNGPSGIPRIITDGTQSDGGMLFLAPGTYTISTWIYSPEPGVTYGSAIEVQPA